MKSERRHELQTNSLAHALGQLPQFWALYGNKVLIGLIIVVLIIVLLVNRSASRKASLEHGKQTIVAVQQEISQLQGLRPLLESSAAEGRLKGFTDTTARIESDLNAIGNTDDPATLAQALLLRGDLNWAIATYPELPEATTRPALALPADRTKALAEAEEMYTRALNAYSDRPLVKSRAALSLAAIAEQKQEWAKAGEFYQQVIDDTSAPDALRTLARKNLESLPSIEKPIYIAPATQPVTATDASVPATQPVE